MISACLLAAALAFSPEDAKAVFDLTGEFVRECPVRDAGTVEGHRAAAWLKARLSCGDGKVESDSFRAPAPGGEGDFVNLSCFFERVPGAPWTVLVSHYDTKPGRDCPGANDGGCTSCLLLRLAAVLSANRDFKRNVMLVWTDAEECRGERYAADDGLQGSRRAAAMLKEKGFDVRGVYVLDMLGDADLRITLPPNGSPELFVRVESAAERLRFGRDRLRRGSASVIDDHVPFLKAGFPAVDLIDFEYGSQAGLNDYWHTPNDTPEHLSSESLLLAGRLVCGILNGEAE